MQQTTQFIRLILVIPIWVLWLINEVWTWPNTRAPQGRQSKSHWSCLYSGGSSFCNPFLYPLKPLCTHRFSLPLLIEVSRKGEELGLNPVQTTLGAISIWQDTGHSFHLQTSNQTFSLSLNPSHSPHPISMGNWANTRWKEGQSLPLAVILSPKREECCQIQFNWQYILKYDTYVPAVYLRLWKSTGFKHAQYKLGLWSYADFTDFGRYSKNKPFGTHIGTLIFSQVVVHYLVWSQ